MVLDIGAPTLDVLDPHEGEPPDGPGSHFPSTVLAGVTPDMSIMQEEAFGP